MTRVLEEILNNWKIELRESAQGLLQEEGGVVLCRKLFHKLQERVKTLLINYQNIAGIPTLSSNGNGQAVVKPKTAASPTRAVPVTSLWGRVMGAFSGGRPTNGTNTFSAADEAKCRATAATELQHRMQEDITAQLISLYQKAEAFLSSEKENAIKLRNAWRKVKVWLQNENKHLERGQRYEAGETSFRLKIPVVSNVRLELNALLEKYDYTLEWAGEPRRTLGDRLLQTANDAIRRTTESAPSNVNDLEAALVGLKSNPKRLEDFFIRAQEAATPMLEYAQSSMRLGDRSLPRSVYVGYPEEFEIDFKSEMNLASLAAIDRPNTEIVSLRAYQQLAFTQKVIWHTSICHCRRPPELDKGILARQQQ